MAVRKWLGVGLGCVLGLWSVSGCGDDGDGPGPLPPAAQGGAGEGAGGLVGGSAPGGSSAGGDTGATGGNAGAAGGGAVAFSIIDEPSTDCVPLGATPVELYAADASEVLHSLTPVGDRWAARASHGTGFVLFDADGQNASTEPIVLGYADHIAGSSSELSVVSPTDDGAVYGRYDSGGALVGSSVAVAAGSIWGLAVGRSEQAALVVLMQPTGPTARPVAADGTVGSAIELEPGFEVEHFSAAVSAAGPDRFALAWSDRRLADGVYRTFFLLISQTGEAEVVRAVHSGTARHDTIQLVATSDGFALLQELDDVPLVVPLDEDGFLAGPAHRFIGTDVAFGIASSGEELVLLARREDVMDGLRALDPTGTPTGDWVCLMDELTGSEHSASIQPDSSGYTIIFRDIDESEKLVHVADATTGS